MSEVDTTKQITFELTHLHATTCQLMTCFIDGHHYPKLVHLIVQKLELLLSHPDLAPVSPNRTMYQQHLEHWQSVTSLLLEKKSFDRKSAQYP